MMSPAMMKELLRERGETVEKYLAVCLDAYSIPQRLKASMLYSLQAGGKRMRPVLCMSTAALCGLSSKLILPFAAAIEMIHTYSLIHDDLPAMDDDDLRRGKPSNHKAFDEATAILAGDALLTDAFLVACRSSVPAEFLLEAIRELARAAGSAGMVGGQQEDISASHTVHMGLDRLRAMHARKTGALLRASCLCGAILAGTDRAVCEAIAAYGESLGVAFQIADDILDVVADTATLGKPAGSDSAHGKQTYPALLGLSKSRRLARQHAHEAQEALQNFEGPEADFLRALASYTVERAA